MTALYANITETDIFTTLRAFVLGVVDCEVIRTQGNRVPLPKNDFIAITQRSAVPLETNTHAYTATTETVSRPTLYTMQIDSYGVRSQDRALTIATMLRDDVSIESFKTGGLDIVPLYAGDAKQLPIITGEDQYLERWTFDALIQANPIITLAIETANTLTVDLIDVDRVYAP